jgi:hypothetical protein
VRTRGPDTAGRCRPTAGRLKRADLPLEVVILLIAALTLLITGALLFPVSTGALSYYENGLYGLLLVMFSLQMVALGKTPFGDMTRSRVPLVIGVVIAAVGITTVFIPDVLSEAPRILLFICFCPGGISLLLQMLLAKAKLRAWRSYGGFFRHLIASSAAVYVLSIVVGVLVLVPDLLTTEATAAVVLLYGAAIVYLALVLRTVYLTYPEAEQPHGRAPLSVDRALLLVMGVFMVLLGLLLVPVSLGKLPFAGSAQLGLLMVIFAVQMVAAGSTPIGAFTRSWLMIVLGLVFAGLGIVSCIIPDILVPLLTILVGVLNILGGVLTLIKTIGPRLRRTTAAGAPEPSALRKLFAATVIMNALTIVFGTTMLVSGLLPGLVIGVVLAANGCVLLYLVHVLGLLEQLQAGAPAAAEQTAGERTVTEPA